MSVGVSGSTKPPLCLQFRLWVPPCVHDCTSQDMGLRDGSPFISLPCFTHTTAAYPLSRQPPPPPPSPCSYLTAIMGALPLAKSIVCLSTLNPASIMLSRVSTSVIDCPIQHVIGNGLLSAHGSCYSLNRQEPGPNTGLCPASRASKDSLQDPGGPVYPNERSAG